MSGTWRDSWYYQRGPLRKVPRTVALTQSQRIHDILCRLSRNRRIEQEEAEGIAWKRASKTSYGAASTILSNLGRSYWGHFWYYAGGELRNHKWNMFGAVDEAIRERRLFNWIEIGEEIKKQKLYEVRIAELCQLQTTLKTLRKEIRNERFPT